LRSFWICDTSSGGLTEYAAVLAKKRGKETEKTEAEAVDLRFLYRRLFIYKLHKI